jgi:hypothetical protein
VVYVLLSVSVVVNVAHAWPLATWLGRFLAGLPPMVLLLAFEGLLREHEQTRRDQALEIRLAGLVERRVRPAVHPHHRAVPVGAEIRRPVQPRGHGGAAVAREGDRFGPMRRRRGRRRRSPAEARGAG